MKRASTFLRLPALFATAIIVAGIAFGTNACTQTTLVPENEFHIEGKIAGLRDSVILTLFKFEGNTGIGIATDTVIGGRFSFIVPLTENANLSISGPYEDDEFPSIIRDIWAESGEKIIITGEGTLCGTWRIKSRIPEQREADRYIFKSKDEYIRRQQLSIEINKARKIADSEIGKATRDSLNALEDELQLTIFHNSLALMGKTPVSEIWLEELSTISMMIKHYEKFAVLREAALQQFERLTPEQKELAEAQDIKINLFPPEKVGVGDKMADATLKALDGSVHTLSDYLGKGKYIILDFWGSGCGPCYQSMPELRELAAKYPDTLQIIGINTDTSEKGWQQGTELFGPTWLNLNAPPASDIDERYGINGIPHVVIISPDGVILEFWAGYGPGLTEERLSAHINKTK